MIIKQELEQCFQIIAEGSGQDFDPIIAEVFLDMKEKEKLHDLELLSFFGATMAYRQRNYDKMLSINSFPEDCFSHEEALQYSGRPA